MQITMWFIWASLFTVLLTGTLAVKPNKPSNFRVNQTYSTALELTWDAGTDALYYQLKNGETTLELPSSSTSYNFTHLKPYTKYMFHLQSVGYFEFSDEATAEGMTCAGVADGVTGVVATVEKDQSISVKWDLPKSYHGAEGPTKLDIWTPNGKNDSKKVEHPGTAEKFSKLGDSLPYYVSLKALAMPGKAKCGGGYGKEFLAGLLYVESQGALAIDAPVVTLTATGATGLRAEWTQNEPSTQPKILAYTYKLTEGSRLVRFGHLPVTARSLMLNKLTPNTDYELEVSANGLYTHGIARKTAKTLPGVPGSVGDVTATMKGKSLEANWTAPAYAPGTISGYQCVLYSGSFPTERKTVQELKVTFNNLVENAIYRVGVSATIKPNSQNLGGGTGPESLSNFVGSSGVEESDPSPPSNLHAEAVGPNAIKITWTAPTPGNVPVYYYKITISEANRVIRTEVAAGTDVLRLLTGLKPETEYDIAMETVTMQAISTKKTSTKGTTAIGVPSLPEKVTAALVKPAEIQVTWTKPTYVGTGLTGYRVSMRQGGDEVKSQNVDKAATSCVFPNPPEFSELVFAVTATSAEGTSEAGLSNTVYTQAKA